MVRHEMYAGSLCLLFFFDRFEIRRMQERNGTHILLIYFNDMND